jgi:hypothetical protein
MDTTSSNWYRQDGHGAERRSDAFDPRTLSFADSTSFKSLEIRPIRNFCH